MATNRTSTLASPPTLHRFEMLADRNFAISAHKAMVESFITSFDTPPKELVLDFDATDDLVHGNQEGKFYHGYYGNHCFLPLTRKFHDNKRTYVEECFFNTLLFLCLLCSVYGAL